MRRFAPLLLVVASLALIAASASPKPSPSPSRSPSPAPTATATAPAPVFAQVPTVVIYPFDTQSGADPKIGMAISQILSQEMKSAGGINVLAIPSGVARANFQSYARGQHADFYISGYVTPIGDTASVVEQVVTVDSGVILFSQTAQVNSVDDVASQSLLARSQILAFTSRGTQNIQSQSASTPAPAASNGSQVKLGLSAIVDSVFHHRGAATPAPTAAPAKPARGVIVAPVSAIGTAAPGEVGNATNELYFALARKYNASMTTAKGDLAKTADSICGTHRDNTIVTGTIGPKHGRDVEFTLQVYTCFGVVLATASGKGGSIKAAVDAAVAQYATAHPDNS